MVFFANVLFCRCVYSLETCALCDVISLCDCNNNCVCHHIVFQPVFVTLSNSLRSVLTFLNKCCMETLLLHVHEWLQYFKNKLKSKNKVTAVYCTVPLFNWRNVHTWHVIKEWIMLHSSLWAIQERQRRLMCYLDKKPLLTHTDKHTHAPHLTTYTFLFLDFAPESKLSFALSCTEDAMEEDEFSSLWSTTSSFIFLFISSLFYSMVFTLAKVNM